MTSRLCSDRISSLDRSRVASSRRAHSGGALRIAAAAALVLCTTAYGCVIPISSNDIPPADGGTSSGGSSSGAISSDAAIPSGSWKSATGNLANLPSECGNLAGLFVKPDEDMVLAGVAGNGLWASRDGGKSWQVLGAGAGSTMITNRPTSIVFDPDVPTRFWVAGIYGGAIGVYRTTDDGMTFTALGTIHHNDSISVDLTDPMRNTLVVGGHEQAQTVYRSTDQGMNWSDAGTSLPAKAVCTFPLVLDAQTYLVGCGEDGSQGIYRTTDGAMTWTAASDLGGGGEPLVASDGIYWATANGSGVIVRSTDQGVSWTQVTPSGTAIAARPVELPDKKRIATIGPVSGMQTVIVSSDQGKTWVPASPVLPYPDARGVLYSTQQKAFFIWHFTCGAGSVPVPPDAIMRFDWDYTKN
jgi:hypothetical protein